MCAKTLKGNGEYSYQSSLRGLTAQELADPVQLRLRQEFDRRIAIKLSPKAKLEDFPDQQDIKTPHHEMYDDNNGGGADSVPDRNDLGDQNFDNHLNAEVLLPMGEHQQTEKVKQHKVDEHWNRMGKSHSNPILDTRVCDV